jgi:mono/diheme cytochrome c family protein
MTGHRRSAARTRPWALALAAVAVGLLAALAALAQDSNSTVKKLNPYTGKPEAIQQGRTLWLQYGCSGCHGVGGGGGMAKPVIDGKWKFGGDDETLYKLIKGQIDAQTMPKIFEGMPDDDLWKIVAYVRSIYAGDKGKVTW